MPAACSAMGMELAHLQVDTLKLADRSAVNETFCMQPLHSALLAPGDKEALLDALAAAAGMPVPAMNRAAVLANLIVAADMAASLFAAEPTPERAELAPVFTPGAHGARA